MKPLFLVCCWIAVFQPMISEAWFAATASGSELAVAALPASQQAAKPATLADIQRRLSGGQPTTIVCFGDSITGAYYHSGGARAWCDMLGLALQKANPHAQLTMHNAGVSGHTTVNALARIDRDVLALQPQLVVVMFGMNDVTRVGIEDYTANLHTIVDKCQAVGAAVVLCTPNPVIENAARPNSKLAAYSEKVREVAAARGLSVTDCFKNDSAFRQQDPLAWSLTMSDDIHPNMTGHKRFAEQMTQTICGKQVSLDSTSVPHDALRNTFDRLQQGEPVHMVAMAPYDSLFAEILQTHFPSAKFQITAWPAKEKNITELAEWAKQIRGLKPQLVIPAVPAETSADSDDIWIRDYEWVLNYSFPFGGRAWDVVPVLPLAANSAAATTAGSPARLELSRRILQGKDTLFIQRDAADERSEKQIVADWIVQQKKVWQGLRNVLPVRNAQVHVPAQSWAHEPGPRTVRVTVHYPDGTLDSVDQHTGIMLSLHNWGGEDCGGSANPAQLAERLNVVAICVNYLQSGRVASVEAAEPYDFGHLQALDVLRALAFVRNGLKQANRAYDDQRIFCTGGSGGGNVTLMAHKLAPRTFTCLIDMCGMKKLSDDIAFQLPGGSTLNARWSRDPDSLNYLTADQQALRFVGHPDHLRLMKQWQSDAKIVVVHGVEDHTCPFEDAQELVANLKAADLPVDAHFIDASDLDGKVFTSSGHALGNRTEIVFQVAGSYLLPDSPTALRREGPTDFERATDIRYPTENGTWVISYVDGIPVSRFEPAH